MATRRRSTTFRCCRARTGIIGPSTRRRPTRTASACSRASSASSPRPSAEARAFQQARHAYGPWRGHRAGSARAVCGCRMRRRSRPSADRVGQGLLADANSRPPAPCGRPARRLAVRRSRPRLRPTPAAARLRTAATARPQAPAPRPGARDHARQARRGHRLVRRAASPGPWPEPRWRRGPPS